MNRRMTSAHQPFLEKKSAKGQITAPMIHAIAPRSQPGKAAERDMKSITRCSNMTFSRPWWCTGSATSSTVDMPTSISAAMERYAPGHEA